MRPPTWARLLYRYSRALDALNRAQEIVRDELLFGYLPPEERTKLTFDVYAETSSYLEGGELFVQGLFPWEAALLANERVPRAGRVLLGAAGGGRELLALLARGYEVTAFEPVQPFFESARAVARGTNALVLKGSYADLVRRAHRESGPLEAVQGPFDLCLLGWGSLSHLNGAGDAIEVLRAFRVLAPAAPVLTSFWGAISMMPTKVGRATKLRRAMRRMVGLLGGRPFHPGLTFLPDVGFMHTFTKGELADICAHAGYELALFDENDYPHALLVPRAESTATVG